MAPRLPLAGRTAEGGGWRERQAAREAGRGMSPAPATEAATAAQDTLPRRTGYVPPALRANGAIPGAGSRPPSARDTPSPAARESPSSAQETLPRRGGYVLPHLRNQQ
jgi:translation initiation factor 3 subunit A